MFLKFSIQIIQVFFKRIKPHVWVLSGKELSSQHELSIAYAGYYIQYKNYITQIAFGQSFNERYIGRFWIWNIRKIIKKVAPECSLAVIEIKFVELFFMVKNGFKIPRWVETILDISKSVDQMKKRKSFKTMIRRTRKNNYTYKVTRDKSLLENFYYKMYVPFVKNTHGNTAYVKSYKSFEKASRYSDLLLLKKEDIFVAGLILEYSKRGMYSTSIGIKDGDYKYVKEGAVDSLNYFSILWLKEKGYSKVSLGASNSFLKDGGLKYKVLKGAQIEDKVFVSNKNVVIIEFLRNSQGLRDFLINNPFIFYPEKRKRHAALFIEKHQPLSQADIEELLKPYKNYNGIEKFDIYVFGEDKHLRGLEPPPEVAKEIEIHSAQCLFNTN